MFNAFWNFLKVILEWLRGLFTKESKRKRKEYEGNIEDIRRDEKDVFKDQEAVVKELDGAQKQLDRLEDDYEQIDEEPPKPKPNDVLDEFEKKYRRK